MAFVSCDKQISSFATAIGNASVQDKQAIVAALSVNKDVAFVESTVFKKVAPRLRPNPNVLPTAVIVNFTAADGDISSNASFGNWNVNPINTFTFLKAGNYYITYDASLSSKKVTAAPGYWVDTGSFFRIGNKDWYASGCKFDYSNDAMEWQNGGGHGSITVSVQAGQTLQLFGFHVQHPSYAPNDVYIGAPITWTWGIQITQV